MSYRGLNNIIAVQVAGYSSGFGRRFYYYERFHNPILIFILILIRTSIEINYIRHIAIYVKIPHSPANIDEDMSVASEIYSRQVKHAFHFRIPVKFFAKNLKKAIQFVVAPSIDQKASQL